jgi:hypothetical protein
MAEMSVFEAIHGLRATRIYQDRPVPDDVLDRILEAARSSARSSSRWSTRSRPSTKSALRRPSS